MHQRGQKSSFVPCQDTPLFKTTQKATMDQKHDWSKMRKCVERQRKWNVLVRFLKNKRSPKMEGCNRKKRKENRRNKIIVSPRQYIATPLCHP
jgi:hypothetical protein